MIFHYQGKRVSVACKVVYSKDKLWRRVHDGFRQCEKFSADVDVVFVNVTAIAHVHEMFSNSRIIGFIENDTAVCWSKKSIKEWCDSEGLLHAMKWIQRQLLRPCMVAFCVPFLIWVDRVPLAFFLTHAAIYTDERDFEILRRIQIASNDVLGFRAA